MDILNKEKLKEVLERWKGHPSITGLMEKFSQLQSYTNKNYKNFERSPHSFFRAKRVYVFFEIKKIQ